MITVMLVTARGSDLDVDRQSVSLHETATRAWDGLTAGTATLAVETDRTVRGDPVHLRHLLENLFRNSIEHATPDRNRSDDEYAAEPDASDATVKTDGGDGVTVRVGDLAAGFFVEDDGPGISEDERDAIFEAGYSTDSKGVGLGLTFVVQLVETYGWEYNVTESDAGGARFEFRDVEFA
jgi:signal transduction histidine kinase